MLSEMANCIVSLRKGYARDIVGNGDRGQSPTISSFPVDQTVAFPLCANTLRIFSTRARFLPKSK